MTAFQFDREEIIDIAASLNIKVPKNLGDVLYSYRYRKAFPQDILDRTPPGMAWVILPSGRGRYNVELRRETRIVPRPDMVSIKIPDATPEIIKQFAKGDEQAILARVRYNRLVDIFLGITTYSLQNHFRTTVSGLGQIEIDELYVGVNRDGVQFVVPIQAKVKDDHHSIVQTLQDLACCREKFPELLCRAVSAQFVEQTDTVVMFELVDDDGDIKVKSEKHYKLVPYQQITDTDRLSYRQ